MSRITNRSIAAGLLVWMAVVFAGCGGGGDVASPGTSNNPGTPGTPATPQARSVTLDASSVTLVAGQTRQLTATVSADAGFTGSLGVTWTSANPLIASVTGGLVTAVAAGTTTITATSAANSSLSAQAAVTVTDACSPIGVPLGAATQGSFQPTCTISGLGSVRVFGYTPSKSVAVAATLTPAQSLAIGLDFEHFAQAQPTVGGSQVTYALLLPSGAQRLAVFGTGTFALTVDTTQAAMLNAQTCTVLAMPGASAQVTLGRNCLTLDVYSAWTSGKVLTVSAQNSTITPSVQGISLPSNAPFAQGTSDQATHTTTLSILPAANQFVRIQLLNGSSNQTNVVTVTVSQ